jgi:hypothetical protein
MNLRKRRTTLALRPWGEECEKDYPDVLSLTSAPLFFQEASGKGHTPHIKVLTTSNQPSLRASQQGY